MIFFVLGTHPDLSIAEIKAVLGRSDDKGIVRAGEILLVDEVEMSLPNLQNRLGGTIKIGSIIGSLAKWNKDEAADLIRSMMPSSEGRIEFGVSGYGSHLSRNVEPLGLEVKKKLKEEGLSCRLVTSREATLSSVVIAKNHLLTSGGEYVLIEAPPTTSHPTQPPLGDGRSPDRGSILIGQTETIQDFESWSERDFGRPARDAKSGMLPPKLARLMINLSGVDPRGASVLDPFCGSGTILMESAVLGFAKIFGSDISPKAIKDTDKNMRWVFEKAHAPKTIVSTEVSPAAELSLDEQVDLVVTEPFLGPPQRGGESKAQLIMVKNELMGMYLESFANIRELMKPGAKLVVAFPIFQGQSVMSKPLPGFEPQERFVYERSGQRVVREIRVYVRV